MRCVASFFLTLLACVTAQAAVTFGHSASGLSVSGAPVGDFTITVGDIPRAVTQATWATVTNGDRVVTHYTSTGIYHDKQITITPNDTLPPAQTFVLASSSPGVATVTSGGYVTHASDGTTRITVTYGRITKGVSLTLVTDGSTGNTADVFQHFVTGSLGAVASAAVDTRLAGKSSGAALALFTTQNHAGATYLRNTAAWAADLDLTPISPWNSAGGAYFAGTLVSPRHIVFATHYQIPVGATVRFVTMGNQVVDRVMTARQSVPHPAALYPDITVGLLDSDVPSSISYCRVLPSTGLEGKVSSQGLKIPLLTLDQEEKGIVSDLFSVNLNNLSQSFVNCTRPTDTQRLAFYEDKIGGDSGNPCMMIVNGQLVLLTVWTFGGPGSGTNIAAIADQINAAMTTLGGGYQLTTVDLSAFPNY